MLRKLAVAWLVVLACASVLAWFILPDPELGSLVGNPLPPSREHWLGTDHLGRDVLSQLMRVLANILMIATGTALVATIVAGSIATLHLRYSPGTARAVYILLTAGLVILGAAVEIWQIQRIMAMPTYDIVRALIVWGAMLSPILLFGLAVLIKRRAVLTVETPERDRWTGWGWRLVRVYIALFVLAPVLVRSPDFRHFFGLPALVEIGLREQSVLLALPLVVLTTVFVLRLLYGQVSAASARLVLRRSIPSLLCWGLLGALISLMAAEQYRMTSASYLSGFTALTDDGLPIPLVTFAAAFLLTIAAILTLSRRNYPKGDRSSVFH